jgi:amidase
VTTFITKMDPGSGTGPVLAVKDLIDVSGIPTTAGCRAVAHMADPATADAACMRGAREAGARISGKSNLFELAYGASGVNEWFGTPRNPLDASLLPGGSSSGSAVAVATGEADIAYGTDTGGSIRVPSAFCGTAGLKTTFGLVPVEGVRPLAASLDTVGPMATDIKGLVAATRLLLPGFDVDGDAAVTVGRVRVAGVDVDPLVDSAVDAALSAGGFEVLPVRLAGWRTAYRATTVILDFEAFAANRHLVDDEASKDKVGKIVATRLAEAARVTPSSVAEARSFSSRWRDEIEEALSRVQLLALPTVPFFPPPLDQADKHRFTVMTNPVNLAGLPAVALPVRTSGSLPASVQLVGPAGGEALLLATALVVEAAVARAAVSP